MQNNIILHQLENQCITINVMCQNDRFWLSQKMIAGLFGFEFSAISKHLTNIYDENELEKSATISILETVQLEENRNVKRNIEHYNLHAIITIGYSVNSK